MLKKQFGIIKEFCHKYRLIPLFSSIFSLVLSLINFISFFSNYNWSNIAAACSYLFFSIGYSILNFTAIEKRMNPYLFGALLITLLLMPMLAYLYFLFSSDKGFTLLFDWVVYLYALYAFIKISLAIKNLVSRKKDKESKTQVNFCIGLISAAYTMSLLANHLIEFTNSKSDQQMRIVLIVIQFAVFLLDLITIVYFLYCYCRERRQRNEK